LKLVGSKFINYFRKGYFRVLDILAFESHLLPMSYATIGIFQI